MCINLIRGHLQTELSDIKAKLVPSMTLRGGGSELNITMTLIVLNSVWRCSLINFTDWCTASSLRLEPGVVDIKFVHHTAMILFVLIVTGSRHSQYMASQYEQDKK